MPQELLRKKSKNQFGTVIFLDQANQDDLDFIRQLYGFEAEADGWVREKDRLYCFSGQLSAEQATEKLQGKSPPGIMEIPAPPLPEGPVELPFFTLNDGTSVTWIRHPSALPKEVQKHWRSHTALFVIKGRNPDFHCYTSVHSFANLEGADGKFRIFAPGGIRWIDYPGPEAAMADAMDMSLAVAMKIQVVLTPNGGNKIAVYGDIRHKDQVLRSIFSAYECLGCIVTSADLGLSMQDLERCALPVAPTSVVPLGVYDKGIPSAIITADAAFAGLKSMAKSLTGAPELGRLTVSLQGCGEVGFRLAGHLLESGTSLIIAEPSQETREKLCADHRKAFDSGQVTFLSEPDCIYDTQADIFCPCALRDILTLNNLRRLQNANIKLIGGPANNLFTDQNVGPWLYHENGLTVVPYEGIGAGGVTGVAYSVMSGVYGASPFTPQQKIDMIGEYVAKILRWSKEFDLPPQVISDRILFRSTQRRRLIQQKESDEMMQFLMRAFAQERPELEEEMIREITKKGFFYNKGRFPGAGAVPGDC